MALIPAEYFVELGKYFFAQRGIPFLPTAPYACEPFYSLIGSSPSSRMGSGKKEAARRERQGKTGDGMANVKVKGENFYR